MPNKDKEIDRQYKSKYMLARNLLRKQKAIAYKGGKCKKCGYDKCPAALVFHHRDAQQKELDWAKLKIRRWDDVLKELDKCDLLCCRCHAETHFDQRAYKEILNWATLHQRKPRDFPEFLLCSTCSSRFKLKTRGQLYCSRKCTPQAQNRAKYPSDNEFIKLVKTLGRVKVAKMFGVSHRAIAKRFKRRINQ